METIKGKIMGLYRAGVYKRALIIWIAFQTILWVVFGITCYFHSGAWTNLPEAGLAAGGTDVLLKFPGQAMVRGEADKSNCF